MQVLWFALLIGVLITVHEAGHLLAARLLGVRVLRFSLGFGPRLLNFRRGGTEYALSLVPLGGYVTLLGEDDSEGIAAPDREHAFAFRPLWQRLAILFAGPLANLVLPAFVYFHFHITRDSVPSATVGTVFEWQPADQVLLPGDRIVAIDGLHVRYWDEVNEKLLASPGRDLRVTVERPGEDKPLTRVITPRAHLRRDSLGGVKRIGLIGIAAHFQLPQIGVLEADPVNPQEPSPAFRAGLRTFDVVTSVQGRRVTSWTELDRALGANRGEAVLVTYLRRRSATVDWAAVAELEPGSAMLYPTRAQGAKPWMSRFETGIRSGELFLAQVAPGSPAAAAGLHPGDEIVSVDGTPVRHWELFGQFLEDRRERPFAIGWRTPRGESRTATVRLQSLTEHDEFETETTRLVFGGQTLRATRPVPAVPVEGKLGWSVRRALGMTLSVTWTTMRVLARLLTGDVPASALGGPILIYHLAGVAATHGPDEFLAMLAIISLNLGLLNLLPIPLLDGGQLAFMLVETIRKRPIGRRFRERATYVGMAILGALMLLALRNDILRFWPR